MLTIEETNKRNLLKKEKPYVYEKIMNYDEKIAKGESIAIIQFQYDYTCNFACQHCSIKRFQQPSSKRSFTIPDVRSLSNEADYMGLGHFVITGGEPLIFPDFDELVSAIDPQKFYISTDTNGWNLTKERAHHIKSIGIDKVQLSIDSLDPSEHDIFRRKHGSHARAMAAVDHTLNAGLNIIIQTVVTKERLHSTEFIKFLEFFTSINVPVFVTYAKPVGAWEGNFSVLIDKDDMKYMRQLETYYKVFTHLTPSYNLSIGCIAVKRMVSVTKYGDVMSCPFIHASLGNFFHEPLKDIIQRGLNTHPFNTHIDTCLVAEDRNFIDNYITKTYNSPLPVPYEKLFTESK